MFLWLTSKQKRHRNALIAAFATRAGQETWFEDELLLAVMVLEDEALTAAVAVNYTGLEVKEITKKAKEHLEKPPATFVDEVAMTVVSLFIFLYRRNYRF